MATKTENAAAVSARKRRPQRRVQIQEAALRLFYEKGYAQTSMGDIGTAVGMAGPSIYRHFSSKAAILESVLQPLPGAYFDDFEAVFSATTDPARRLEELVESYVHWVADDPVMTALAMEARHALSEEQRADLDRIDRRLRSRWVDAVTAARPEVSRAEARTLVGAAIRLVLAITLTRSGMGVQRVHALARRAMLAALKA